MDFPSSTAHFPAFAAGTTHALATAAGLPRQAELAEERAEVTLSPRARWVSRVIDAQSSRVVGQTEDAVELRPLTIESRPPAHIQRFLDVAANGRPREVIPGNIIDT